MSFSPQASPALSVLSDAYAAALGYARSTSPRILSQREDANLSRQITLNLLDAHDSGVRDPAALSRAALQGVVAA